VADAQGLECGGQADPVAAETGTDERGEFSARSAGTGERRAQLCGLGGIKRLNGDQSSLNRLLSGTPGTQKRLN
jgi:hypothetical protein